MNLDLTGLTNKISSLNELFFNIIEKSIYDISITIACTKNTTIVFESVIMLLTIPTNPIAINDVIIVLYKSFINSKKV